MNDKTISSSDTCDLFYIKNKKLCATECGDSVVVKLFIFV